MKPALYNTTLPELETLMYTWGQPAFRAKQLYRQAYVKLNTDIATMTDLPLSLRTQLATDMHITQLHLLHERSTDNGETRKALFALSDDTNAAADTVIETVLMSYAERTTVCVSTQSGCAMGCSFCATGQMGLVRNLSSGEIVEQVLWAARQSQHHHNAPQTESKKPERQHLNVVFMGMGEPFANYDAWWAAVERLHDPQGFNLGARRMTVSTVGLVPGIQRLAEERIPINLAISLHAPNDTLRNELVPVNQRYPLADILNAARAYVERTGRRVSFEYVLLQGYNDTPQHAQMLGDILRRFANPKQTCLYHVNLIPWNPVPGVPLDRSRRERALAFQDVLQEQRSIACTVRVERGIEIAAACGQLAGTHTTEKEHRA